MNHQQEREWAGDNVANDSSVSDEELRRRKKIERISAIMGWVGAILLAAVIGAILYNPGKAPKTKAPPEVTSLGECSVSEITQEKLTIMLLKNCSKDGNNYMFGKR